MKAVILAGGFGTRLRERITEVPKPMAPIAGRPFLEYLLDTLNKHKVSEVILATGYMANKISDHFSNQYKDIKLSYAVEEKPLGTGGAILYAIDHLSVKNDEPILVLNGDTFLKTDFTEFYSWYKDNEIDLGLVLREVENISRYGSVKLNGDKIIGFQEKGPSGSGLINGGIYILQKKLFSSFKVGESFSFEEDILQKIYTKFRTCGYISDGFFLDIGTPQDFDKAQTELPQAILTSKKS
ncbi:D-glycero-D-manno-heptose 1-phosphate guanosyltransferase [Terasakiella brassicae]|uniref:D-glycero-D-manno-heptose 1-phosphate guanosyltransferase n=1 Tax=Terasakiella brassicae TaxID=1634917 RepID=A0A917C7Q4_9PROT|nr:nucleotidyltransferase family protein [Terasakiella brassicae]GGF75094.1 D-glycero-D-manno-heptose 1-phosphate guanosyltransferase [Terasakiella brassicae]